MGVKSIPILLKIKIATWKLESIESSVDLIQYWIYYLIQHYFCHCNSCKFHCNMFSTLPLLWCLLQVSQQKQMNCACHIIGTCPCTKFPLSTWWFRKKIFTFWVARCTCVNERTINSVEYILKKWRGKQKKTVEITK